METDAEQLNRILDFFYRYPEKLDPFAKNLQRVDTHISAVLITPQKVFKFKKSVDFSFISQIKLSQRKENCLQEVALNSRLSPSIYRGVWGIHRLGSGFLISEKLDGAVEYVVEMQHLNENCNLASLVQTNQVKPEMIIQLAHRLGNFHSSVDRGEKISLLHSFRQNFLDNLSAIASFKEHVPTHLIENLEKSLSIHLDSVQKRDSGNKIIDGHGDLRLDHIYFDDSTIHIIDCLEFSPSLRAVDPYEDLAFLTLGFGMEGKSQLRRYLAAQYVSYTLDLEGLFLLPLYELYRAGVRAKIDCIQYQKAKSDRKNYYLQRFNKYIGFMQETLKEMAVKERKLKLVIVTGLPATGKSTYANEYSLSTGFPVISTDVVRKRMHQVNPYSHQSAGQYSSMYSSSATEINYQHCFDLADSLLKAGYSVIVEGTFAKRVYREKMRELACKYAIEIEFYHVTVAEEIIKERLEKRKVESGISDLLDFGTWKKIADQYEPLDPEQISGAVRGCP